jgi:transposase
VPPAGIRADRGPGRGQPAVHPGTQEVTGPRPRRPPRTRPDAVAADKAYSSRDNRAHLRRRGIKAVIPEKKDQAANRKKKGSGGGRPVSHDAALCKERNTVERLINKLKAWRGIATRYDKTPDSYLAGLHPRASMIWIKDRYRP